MADAEQSVLVEANALSEGSRARVEMEWKQTLEAEKLARQTASEERAKSDALSVELSAKKASCLELAKQLEEAEASLSRAKEAGERSRYEAQKAREVQLREVETAARDLAEARESSDRIAIELEAVKAASTEASIARGQAALKAASRGTNMTTACP